MGFLAIFRYVICIALCCVGNRSNGEQIKLKETSAFPLSVQPTRKDGEVVLFVAYNQLQLRTLLVECTAEVRRLERARAQNQARVRSLGETEQQLEEKLKSERSMLQDMMLAFLRLNPAALFASIALGESPEHEIEASDLVKVMYSSLRERYEHVRALREQQVFVREQVEAQQSKVAGSLQDVRAQITLLKSLAEARWTAEPIKNVKTDGDDLSRVPSHSQTLEELVESLTQAEPWGRTPSKLSTSFSQNAEVSRIQFDAIKGRISLPIQEASILRTKLVPLMRHVGEGIELVTEPLALVTTPLDGRVMYAGSLRSHRQVVLLDVGQGYVIVISGMQVRSVVTHQSVVAGEPIGVMQDQDPSAAIEPKLYVELRHLGQPIKSAVWFSVHRKE